MTRMAGARRLVTDLVREGLFRRIELSLDSIALESLGLAALVTAKTGCRNLDLMHVATARLVGACRFVSTDRRQMAAARLCGLSVVDLEKGRAR